MYTQAYDTQREYNLRKTLSWLTVSEGSVHPRFVLFFQVAAVLNQVSHALGEQKLEPFRKVKS